MIKQIITEYVETGKLMAMTSTYLFSTNNNSHIDLRHDFIQEIALYLLEYKYPEKIIEMYHTKQLDYFIMKIIRIQATSHNCKWYKQFGKYEKSKIYSL